MQQYLVVEYKTCTSYMQLLLPNAFYCQPYKMWYKTSSNFTGGNTCFNIYVFGIIEQLRDYSTLVSLAILDNYDIKRVILQ